MKLVESLMNIESSADKPVEETLESVGRMMRRSGGFWVSSVLGSRESGDVGPYDHGCPRSELHN